MEQSTSATPDYTMGFSEEMLASLMRHSAEAHAAHLLPHVRTGHCVLDFGCGPGTVSVGLAQAAAPGKLHGVDMEESQVELARAIAAEWRQDNAVFHVGDVTDLPFEDGYFDVAHCHDVLMYVPDTQSVLAEVKRVLKPGGVIGCREMICRSSFTHPDFGVIGQAWDMFEDIIATDGGHPAMGRLLKGQLVEAGFENLRMTGGLDFYSSPEEVAFIHYFAQQWFLSHDMTDAALKYGASTEAIIASIREAYDRWKDHPGAVCALAFGEAVASKP